MNNARAEVEFHRPRGRGLKPLLSAAAVLGMQLLGQCALAADVDELDADNAKYTVKVDPNLPTYRPASALSGTLTASGVENLGVAFGRLLTAFKSFHPQVNVSTGRASTVDAVAKLGDGSSQVAYAGRALVEREKKPFKDKTGREPLGVRVSKSMWGTPGRAHPYGIFVNSANPLKTITVPQMAWAFFGSAGGSAPSGKPFTTWEQLGLPESWKGKFVHAYGVLPDQDTAADFKSIASEAIGTHVEWRGGDPYFGGGYVGQIDEQYVAMMCRQDSESICWTGVHIGKAYGLKLLAMPTRDGSGWTDAGLQDYADGKWPLTQYNYAYAGREAGKPLDPLVKEFLEFSLSKQGQLALMEQGFVPLTAAEAKTERSKIQ